MVGGRSEGLARDSEPLENKGEKVIKVMGLTCSHINVGPCIPWETAFFYFTDNLKST